MQPPQSSPTVPVFFTLLCVWACVSIYRAHHVGDDDPVRLRAQSACERVQACESVEVRAMPNADFRGATRHVTAHATRALTKAERAHMVNAIGAGAQYKAPALEIVEPAAESGAGRPAAEKGRAGGQS